MARTAVDKIHAYLTERAPAGVPPEELAHEFLAPASAPAGLCEKLVSGLLSNDPRFVKNPDGKWSVPARRAPEGPITAYTVIEVLEARAATRTCILDCAVCRVDAQGRIGPIKGTAVRPEPWPDGLIIPPALKEAIRDGAPLDEAVERSARFAAGTTIVAWKAGAFQNAAAGENTPVLSLELLARKLLGAEVRTPEALAAKLGIPTREVGSARDHAQSTAELLGALLTKRDKLKVNEPERWVEAAERKRMGLDFSRYEFDRAFLDSLPERPGIYIMREATGAAIYVGKARNLRARVKQYFRPRIEADEKNEQILERVSRIEIEETGSELAALLAENAAIHKLQPPINIQYEVHERPASYKAPGRRLALVLPAPEEGEAEIFMLHGEIAMERFIVSRDKPESLRQPLEKFFFSGKPPERLDGLARHQLEIAWSWLEQNADRVNAFDVDVAGGLEPALRLLERYLKEEPGKRVFHV